MILVSDFETTGEQNYLEDGYVRVWAWHIRDLVSGCEVARGTELTDCMRKLMAVDNTCYFHNLRFDGSFIVDWLLNNDYAYVARCIKKEPRTFSTLISDTEQWYKLEIISPQGKRLEIYDSFKKIPQKAEKIAKDYQLDTVKGSIDYEVYRPVGYEPTTEEWEYIANDTYIICEALKAQIQNGYDSITIGADCMKVFKDGLGKKRFKLLFPELSQECDTFCRKSYKGGYVYCNPKHINKVLTNVIALDVNSLYPFVMKVYKYPYGQPKYAVGKGDEEGYIQHIKTSFKVKDGYLPTIQIKKSMMWSDNEYVTHCEEPVDLYLTKPDLELFLEHYNTTYIEYVDRYVFDMCEGIFDDYIDFFYNKKSNPINVTEKQISKLFLNNLGGKFGTNPEKQGKYPVKGVSCVEYKLGDIKLERGGYVPVAAFMTAYARAYTIRHAQRCGDAFIYADTDSNKVALELLETPINEIYNIDSTVLGAWKNEGIADKFKVLRQKTYASIEDNELHITCCGMPTTVKSQIKSLEQFTYFDGVNGIDYNGELVQFTGKLMQRRVKGGVYLKNSPFTIKNITQNIHNQYID